MNVGALIRAVSTGKATADDLQSLANAFGELSSERAAASVSLARNLVRGVICLEAGAPEFYPVAEWIIEGISLAQVGAPDWKWDHLMQRGWNLNESISYGLKGMERIYRSSAVAGLS